MYTIQHQWCCSRISKLVECEPASMKKQSILNTQKILLWIMRTELNLAKTISINKRYVVHQVIRRRVHKVVFDDADCSSGDSSVKPFGLEHYLTKNLDTMRCASSRGTVGSIFNQILVFLGFRDSRHQEYT